MDLSTFQQYTAWHAEWNHRQYAAPAEPWRLVEVPLTEVTYFTNEIRLNWGLGRVQGGDWGVDGDHRLLRETPRYCSLEQHFEKGVPWERTELYARAAQQIESGNQVRGYESLGAFRERRCEYIDDLYRSIKTEGYRPNEKEGHHPADDNAFEDAYAHHLEPLVVIDRDGEPLLTEGFHRFIIADLLQLDSIPVYVLCRHVEWQRTRDRVAGVPSGEFPEKLSSLRCHPDLTDIMSSSG
ncbi:hypothetical protein ACFQJ7_05185 [Halovenus rubra]|uniref:Uncharacterized protein n=2 Tax=Halovenus rubra TaxID=869890 RepID=A0ACC7DZG5_9EURY|nr:hypothetical protein [Halovenus rubra]